MSDRGGVEAATRRDLKRLPDDLAESSLAESALALARELDDPENSATSKSMCAKAHLEVMTRLRELAPPEERKGQLHALKSGRADRLGSGKPAA